MKKRFILAAALALSLLLSTQVFAATPNKPTTFENFTLIYDGEVQTFKSNTPPLNLNGRTMLPLAYMFDMVNTDKSGTINWDGQERMVTMTNKGTTIKLWIGKPEAEVNGKMVSVGDANPIIYNDKTYVPMGFVGTNFDLVITWDQASRTAFVAQNATLNSIADMLTKADTEYKKVAKFSYDMAELTKYDINTADETIELPMVVDWKVKQDKQDYYSHAVIEYIYPWGDLKVEVYDDGINQYSVSEDKVYKERSGKEFDLKTGLYTDIANDKKNLYSLATGTALDGHIIIDGYVNSSYEPIRISLESTIEAMREELEILGLGEKGGLEQTYVTTPFVAYKIDKTTGMLKGVAITFDVGFDTDLDGEAATVDASYGLFITEFTPNITLNTVIPDSVKKNAK